MPELHIGLNDSPLELVTKNAINRTGSALSKGDVVALDLDSSASETQTIGNFSHDTDDEETHPFAAVVNVATADLDGGIFLVAMDSISDDAIGQFAMQGFVDVQVETGRSALDMLAPVNGATNLSVLADGEVSVGTLMEGNSSGSTANRKVLFNGFALNGAAGSANAT